MSTKSLKRRLLAGQTCFGLFCSIPSAVALEQLALAGYDFIIIDLEHTLISPEQVETMILAAQTQRLNVLVRVPPHTPHLVVALLDAGAAGIVFARIENIDQARQAVGLCHYAPQGQRGLNSTRNNRYGADDDLEGHTLSAANDTLVVAMIESQSGIKNLAAIAGVDGIDAVLEGAADLSQSLGLHWQTQHPKVHAAITKIHDITNSSGKIFCALPRNRQAMLYWRKQGVSMFVLGDDRGVMRRAHQAHLQTYKEIS